MQSNARTSILAVSTAAVLFVSAGCGTAASPQEHTALALLSRYAAVPGNLQHLPGIALSFVDIATVERVEARQQFASHIHGTIVALSPSVRQLFVAFAIGIEEGDNHAWQGEGTAALQAVLDTLTFFEPVPMPAFCPLTADATYAYSPGNPVRVGGDFLEGPLRERAYLEHLRGPDGQPVAYERTGPFEYNGAMLDMYEVRYPGQAEPAVLYVDEYHFGPPKAPIGFSCEGQFPLRAP